MTTEYYKYCYVNGQCWVLGSVPGEALEVMASVISKRDARRIAKALVDNRFVVKETVLPPSPRPEPPPPTSLQRLVIKHAYTRCHYADGVIVAIARRYLRRIRYTCLDMRQHQQFLDQLNIRLRNRFRARGFDFSSRRYADFNSWGSRYLSMHEVDRNPPYYAFSCRVWVGGKAYDVEDEAIYDQLRQYDRVLQLIVAYDQGKTPQPSSARL
jgi:hypothetical protein